jgi:response regulator RpfG family c-di-GMP phosphodiesterase
MSEKVKILYIDDEPDNLTGFKANFRTEYRILLAENAVQAMEHLK